MTRRGGHQRADRGRDLVSVTQIARLLAASIDNLVVELLPNAVRDGHEWYVGSVAGEPGRSMAINRAGNAGVWCDFSAGTDDMKGDALDLVAAVNFRGDKAEAIRWAKSWLGLDGLDPHRLKRTQAAVKRNNDERELNDEQKRERAGRIWAGAEHRINGTPADDYLRGRAIDLRRLGRQPGAIGYSARCWCKETKGFLPAMVAVIQIRKRLVGVHRTYLDTPAPGVARKAQLIEPKKTLGSYRGGVIPLWRGADPRGWSELFDSDGPDESVVLTEGIENGLSIAVEDPSRRVVAAVSLSNMAAVELPACVREIIIAADNDPAENTAAAAGMAKVIATHQARGRRVRKVHAPAPHKDFNDWLQAIRGTQTTAGADEGAQNVGR